MTPLLATLAGDSARGYGMFGGVLSGDFNSIATVTGNGSSSTLSFTSIPSTYTHLQIRSINRDNRAVTVSSGYLTFNSDTASNYAAHYLSGSGSAASSGAASSTTPSNATAFWTPGSSAGASMYGGSIIDILDYANTSKYKTTRVLSGTDQNGVGNIGLFSVLWQSTAAISTIAITSGTGTAWDANSSFALYGIKG
jgi:hypothetical protein